MKTKSIIVAVLILAFLGVGGFLVLNYRNFVTTENTALDEQNQPQGIAIEDKKITDTTKPLNIDVTYPYIAGQDEFNKKVEGIIQSQIVGFKTMSLENDQAVKDTDPQGYAQYPRTYDLKITYAKGQVDANVLSVVLTIYAFTGGAHGNGYFISINYNPATHKEIALADIFSADKNYVKTISDYCMKDIKRQMKERMGDSAGGWVEDGAGANEENFSVFLLKDNSITFYFSPYQVAAYAVGDFQVVMPITGL